jgi:hypothetical protein
MDLKGIEFVDVDGIHLVKDRDRLPNFVNPVMGLQDSRKGGEFYDCYTNICFSRRTLLYVGSYIIGTCECV